MVMTSDQIAAMTGGGQMQAMAGMQHAAMISQQAGAPFAPGGMTTGEAVMGRATNLGASIGMPVMAGATSLLGLDPISMGARGMLGGFGGGIGGAAIGMGLGAVGGVGLMAAQYTAQQMMQGAQQQQMLNASLRQNYQFQGVTGRGFMHGEMGDIGQMMRNISMQQGPGGEFTSMSQLTTLASRMGQMGMGRGIRDAQEFSTRFREMLNTVQEIATAFNTNLEQAQQMMSSMRQSGIFHRQGQVAQQVRQWAQAGGLATEEVSQAMQMGSQFSRMIGGTGVAGAMGGMRTMGQIGVMQQMGVLSEEQVYNLTGQTGAAGRQALAQQQLQSSARFLQGGLGRRFIASMAMEGGRLDPEAAREYEEGGVGTGRTMQQAYGHLGRMDRAEFLRQEGRLRGQALARFGGTAGVAVMSQWLEKRGMDPGGNRGLIFMSRRLGMSVEQVEQQVRQVQMQGMIENRRADAAEDASAWRDIERQRGRGGIAGIQKSINKFKNDINSRMQQWGADLYQEGSDMIERFFNRMTDNFVRVVDRDVGGVMRDVMRGTDSYSQTVAETRLGWGRGLVGQGQINRMANQVFGGGPIQMSQLAASKQAGDLDRLRQRGFGWVADAGTDREFRANLRRADQLENAFLMGSGDAGFTGALNDRTRNAIRMSAAFGDIAQSRGGLSTLNAFGRTMERAGGQQAIDISAAFGRAGGTSEEDLRTGSAAEYGVMGRATRAAGVNIGWRMGRGELQGMGGGGFATETDMAQRLQEHMFAFQGMSPKERRQAEEGASFFGGAAKWALRAGAFTPIGAAFGLVGAGVKAATGYDVTEEAERFVSERYMRGAGGLDPRVGRAVARSFLFTERGGKMALQAFSRDTESRRALIEKSQDEAMELVQKAGGMENLKQDRLQYAAWQEKRAVTMAAQYTGLMADEGMSSEEAIAQIAKELKTTSADVQRTVGGVQAAAGKRQGAMEKEMLRRVAKRGRTVSRKIAASGTFESTGGFGLELTAEAQKGLEGLEVKKGERATTKMGRTREEQEEYLAAKEGDSWMGRFRKSGRGGPAIRRPGPDATAAEIQEYNNQMVLAAEQGTGGGFEMGIGEAYARETKMAAEYEALGTREGAQKAREARQRADELAGRLTERGQAQLAAQVEAMGDAGAAAGIRMGMGIEKRFARAAQAGAMAKRGGGSAEAATRMGLQEMGKMMGLSFTEKDLRQMQKMSPEKLSRMLIERTGVEGTGAEDMRKDFQATVEAIQSGDMKTIRSKMKGIMGSDALAKGLEKKETERMREQDPTYDALMGIKEVLESRLPEKKADGKGDKTQVENTVNVNIESDQTKGGEDK